MKKPFVTILAAGVGFCAFAQGSARAEGPSDEVYYSYAWHNPQLKSDIGVSTILQGGIAGFTDKTMRDSLNSNVEGVWGAKTTIGSHVPIGLDLSYLGSGAKINSLIGSTQRSLVGTTFEAAVRYNILPHFDWNPYVFAGLGYQRYDITGSSFALSDTGLNTSNNLLVVPMGTGIAYRDPSGFVADLHGTFRATSGSNLVLDGVGATSFARMHSWEAAAAVGYEF